MRVEPVTDPGSEWDAFVDATPGATLGHAAGWARVMRDAYGLRPDYFAARSDAGRIEGVLPLIRFRGITGALELVSMPFLDTGGVLTRNTDARRALVAAAVEHARQIGARALELRELAGDAEGDPADQPRVDLVMPLEASEDEQWKALPGKVRNQTRKAEKEGLSIAEAHGPEGLDGLDGFFGPFAINMRDLGSPVHARGFFAAAAAAFGDRLRFVVTHDAGRAVGGLVAIEHAGTVTVPWASTLRSERRRCPNNQIYWEALRWAIGRGASAFDFGRSPRDGGTYRFKLGWGATERPLAWTRIGPDGAPLALRGAGDSALLQRVASLWTRLPVGLTAWLGPAIRRRISS